MPSMVKMADEHLEGGQETRTAAQKRTLPTPAQQRYLIRGLSQAGGKLPLFDEEGQEISARTVNSCIKQGWAERWFANPIKPDWLVCRLTARGYAALAACDEYARETGWRA